MSLRYKGGLISPSVDPLAANITTSPNVAQYNGVFTLQQQAQALNAGQWANDPYYKNTTLLLHADGKANGSQNNTFLDSSTNNLTIIRNGNTTQGSFTPYGPDWSNYFGATGSYLSIPYSSDFNLTGDFTVEMWINPSTLPTANASGSPQYCRLFSFGTYDAANSFGLEINSSATGAVRQLYVWYNGTSYAVSANNAVTTGVWQHIAAVRSGTTISFYVNGVSTGTTITGASAAINTSQSFYIACLQGFESTANAQYLGYISNFSILKGTAKYTANFTPTTTPLPINTTNQTLLTCAANGFSDLNTTTTTKTITANGTSSVQKFSPFPPQYQYTPAVIGGSGYFDGSGDYLQIPMIDIRSATCTLEFWVYIAVGGVAYTIFNNWNSGASVSTSSFTIDYSGSAFQIYSVRPGVSTWDSGPGFSFTKAAVPGMWHHVALTSDGSTSKFFVNGELVGTGAYPLGGANSTYYTIGANTYYGVGYFNGYVSGVRILLGTQLYTSAFTPPTAPPTAITNTQLLCNMTNAGIYDNATFNNLETVGNAQVSTKVAKYGSGSMYFDGTGDYLTIANNPNLQFGTGDFTIEAWVYPTSAVYGNIASKGNYSPGGVAGYFEFRTTDTSKLQFYDGNTDSSVTSSASIPLNTWTHVVVSRSGSIIRLFVNGIADSTLTDAGAFNNTGVFAIGAAYQSGYTNLFYGYIDDLRITKGVARYTGNFIPPKVAFANQ